MRILRTLLALLLLLLPAAGSAQNDAPWYAPQGEERILSFVSDVTIEPDGDLDVTETIRMLVQNQQIEHGIQRDFPTVYHGGPGQKTRVGFSVVSVQRDGKDEPWERMSLSNGVRIRIGSADVTIPPGEHSYVINYRTSRQLIYGAEHDELYWNATGTGWTFPIDMAEARITLPKDEAFGNRAVYTGPQGSTESNAAVVEERPGFIAFRTTRPLGREEGLTVAAAFPKGVVDPPSSGTRAWWWLQDWGALAAALLACLGLAAYYVRAWWIAGRNPRPGTIVPIFTPPDGLSPAAVRYIAKMQFDDRAFSAAMVDLGVRGKLHIAQEDGGFFSKGTTTLTRTDTSPAGEEPILPAPERDLHAKLFAAGETIELKQTNYRTLQAARSALQQGLSSAYEEAMFRKNSSWAVYGLLLIGLAMLAVAVVGLMAAPAIEPERKFGLPLLAIGSIAAAWAVGQYAAKAKGCLSALLWVAVVAACLGAAASALATFASAVEAGAFAVFVPLILLPVAITAFWWMYAPTREGRLVMDRIAGFRQYLSIAEENRLEALHPPEKTPELFERYLPYAIALDVENRWAERFAGVLAAAAAAGATAQTASWYSGQGNVWDNPEGFASDLGSSFASTVSSASASPSSSGGGSSGGGSSGGGGGGGGGSGW